jgi:hypothetical protein
MHIPRLPFLSVFEKRRLRAEIPTVEFYFVAGLCDLIGAAEDGTEKPIVRLGPHTFARGAHLVVVRYANADELTLLRRPWRSVHYVLDDMLPVARACRELPADYRARLGSFADNVLPRILALRPQIVAPSRAILDLFPDYEGVLLDPACALSPPAPERFAHHDGRAPRRLAFLATRSHAASLGLLEAIADGLAARLPGARITVFLGRHLPRNLQRHPAIENRAALAWPAFRRLLHSERFHIGLGLLPDTPFNRGRSITKLLDHAAVGAAGLYSARPPFSSVVREGADGRLLADDPHAWCEAIAQLCRDPDAACRLARAGYALARARGDPARLRAFWLPRLEIEEPAAAP